jgi:prevent-host-death family protein
MRRTVTAMEARRKFGELLEGVYYRGDEVTIERAGKVMGVVVPMARYREIRDEPRASKERLFAAIDAIRADAGDWPEEQVVADVQAAIDEVRAAR